MSPDLPRRARVHLHDPAVRQVDKLNAEEIRRLDRVLAALSARPDLGRLRPDVPLRDYYDDLDRVRVVYFASALQTVIVAVYIEA
ncbi:hypothetical protein [Kitasatospora sp. NPDC088783]|uniref:hypothetical protein n=1 Tax=Kitasatospora sp. NPDC088783 TaxID=3364077 RepID=UPI0038158A34